MRVITTGSSSPRLLKYCIPAGRCFYGTGIMLLGVQQFMYADFRPVFLPEWPIWLHNAVWAYIAGAGLVAAGALIVFTRKATTTALVLGSFFLLFFLAFHVPYQLFISQNSFHIGLWTNALKELALAGGAFVVAGSYAGESPVTTGRPYLSLVQVGSIFFSVTMMAFGIDHFLYAGFVATLVPAWIPGHVFWTYFAGVALFGSGAAIILRVWLKPVALLLGIMIFLWLILLHIPRAIAFPHLEKGNEITSVFQALAFSGIAFVIGGVSRDRKQSR